MAHPTTPNLTRQDFFSTSLSSAVNVGDTVINLQNTPNGSEGYLVIDPNNPATREIIYYWNKTSGTVTCPDATGGSGRGLGGTSVQTHASGTLVIQAVTAEDLNAIANGEGPGMSTLRKEALTNYVIGGAVTATSGLGFQLAATVVYVNGKRFNINATTLTANASNDAYIDITDNGNGTASINQNNVTNGAAAPAVSTGFDGSIGVRIAKVVSGASTVSSVTQSGVDSLGNIIYPTGSIGVNQLQGIKLFGTDAAATGTAPPVTTPFKIQAGSVVCSTTYQTRTFPVAFPNGLLSVVVTNGDGTAQNGSIIVKNPTLTGFDVGSTAAGSYRVNYIAIGW